MKVNKPTHQLYFSSHTSILCFDCALVLCFVMGYVLQFGEIAHKRVHYYSYSDHDIM